MGRIKNWFTNRRLKRLEGDLAMLASKGINYNPKHYTEYDVLAKDPEREYSLAIQEYLVWYLGKPRLIRLFYLHHPELTIDLKYFWQSVTADYIKRHTGIPNTISTKMATILFGGRFTNDVEIFKTNEDGTITEDIDEKKSKQAKNTLEILKDKCLFITRVKEGAITESWSGHLFAKYSYDTDASDFPILEIADVRNAEVTKIRGITTAIIFKNYYKNALKEYVHKEIYTTDDNGDAMILNKLFAINPNGSETEVSLLTLPETSELNPEFHFEGLKGMLAFEKPNKLPNNEFPNSPYGVSDYAGAIPSFDALDEVYSEMVSEVRNNKSKRYVPENMIPHDKYGNAEDLDPFVRNYVKVAGDIDQQAQNKIETTEINDKHESLQKKFDTILTTAINKAGLSPLALGVTGLEAINSSDKSQQERNKTTLETRGMKLASWKPFLEEMLLQLLALYSWMQKNLPIDTEGMDRIDIDFSNCNVSVEFAPYILQSEKELIDTWGSAKSTYRVSSTLNAIRKIHPDWSESQILDEVNRIRFEEGTSFDNPNNLPGLTGLDDTTENDDDKDKDKDITKKVEENATDKSKAQNAS